MRIRPYIFILILIFSVSVNSYAAFLRNVPQELVQPDGTVLHCFATGDEFHNWLHDKNNFTIIQDPQSGYYVYAELVNGKLLPSGFKVGEIDPGIIGLSPGLNISVEEYQEKVKAKSGYSNFKSLKSGPNKGTMENLVVFIRFSDQQEYGENYSYFDNAFNGTNMVSMKSYYDAVSDNQLDIRSNIFPESNGLTVVSYQDGYPRSHYKPYNAVTNPGGYGSNSELTKREHLLLKNATESVRSGIESKNLNLDMDNDGYVDNIVYVIKGKTDGWSDLLWPHKWELFSHRVILSGAEIKLYNFQLSEAFSVSVLCHEMFHSLGAPDLYRYQNRDISPVGPWDLMAETTTPPQHMGVYMKMEYGKWIGSIPTIEEAGTYTLRSLNSDPFAAYKIPSPNSSSEYFVVEYRQKTGQLESSLPGSGLIIYRISPSMNGNSQGPPDEVYIYRPGGTDYSNGDIYNAFFSNASGRTSFNNNTNPSCFLSNGADGGISIRNVEEEGTSISFDVVIDQGFSPPRNLTASASGKDVLLNWASPTSGIGTLGGYKIYRNGSFMAEINNPDVNSYQDEDLPDAYYSYFVTALFSSPDGESSQSNTASARIGSSGKPDLMITNASVNPIEVDPGDLVNISCKLLNNGTGKAGRSVMRIYLSRDQALDASDKSIAYGSMDEVDPGDYLDINGDGLSIPTDITEGSWFVIFVADSDGQVSESNEDNNIVLKTISIGGNGFESPQNLTASVSHNAVTLGWQEPPAGIGTNTGYKIYRDGTLIGSLTNPKTTNFTDSNLPNGAFKYFVTALYIAPQGESGASNEVSVNIEILAKPDLVVRNPGISKINLQPDEEFSVSCDYSNIGTAGSEESTLRLYFSQDELLDGGDFHFAYGTMDPVDPGSSLDTQGSNLTVPEGLSPGDWFVLYVADADKDVDELNEVNNITTLQVTVSSARFNPPLKLDANVNQSTAELFWEAPESGGATLIAYKVYRNDQLIRTISDPGSKEYVDEGLSDGAYRYYVKAVYSNPEGESEPSTSITIAITSNGLADLVILEESVTPAISNPGENVSITCKLLNKGTVSAGYSMLRMYFSRNEYLDDQDIEMAYGTMDPIDPSFYLNITGEDILVPYDIPQGIWNVLFVADADGEILESIEDNNISSYQISIGSAEFLPPVNLQTSVSGNDVFLSWDAPASGSEILQAYKIYRDDEFIALLNDPYGREYRDGDLDPGIYGYHVTAVYSNPEGESAPSNRATAEISSESYPDFIIVEAEVSPLITEPGGRIDVYSKLLNNGNALARESIFYVILTKDQIIDAGDIGLAYGAIDPLMAGEHSDINGSDLDIPDDVDQGMWYIAFVADAEKDIKESNEENNLSFVPLEIKESEFNPPVNLNASVSGSNVILNWQAPIAGSGNLNSYKIYRDGEMIHLAENITQTVFYDYALEPGAYSYYVTAFYLSPYGDSPPSNIVNAEIITTSGPDLIISEAEVNPNQIEPGETISVHCFVRNLGSSPAEENTIRLFISPDSRLSDGDEEIASGILGAIEPGGYIEIRGTDLTLPSSITKGFWNLIFVADADGQVIEFNEGNNSLSISLEIGKTEFNPPENLQGITSGNSVELYWIPPESGPGTHIGYKIYKNGEYLSAFGINDSQPFVDGQLSFGTYTYFISAVYNDPEGESGPSNEIIMTLSSESKPDLIVRNSRIYPSYLDPGGIVSVSCELVNIGNYQAGNSVLSLYISKNEKVDVPDHLIAQGMIDPIAPGLFHSISGEDLIVPESLEPGEYFLLFEADTDEQINELSEENNVEAISIGVTSRKPDLLITDIYLIRDYVNPGYMLRSTAFVYNNGLGKTSENSISYYLSRNAALDGSDTYLNNLPVREMIGEELIFVNNYVQIPEDAARGKQYLIAYVDAGQMVSETDETNNTFAIPVQIGVNGLDNQDVLEKILIFPNPASHLLNVSYAGFEKGNMSMKIYDQLGRVSYEIEDVTSGAWMRNLDISSWQKGCYFVKIRIDDKHFVSSFIKL